jgi:hypothetical protein
MKTINNKQYKEFDVVMLATDKEVEKGLWKRENYLFNNILLGPVHSNEKYQHLYILSDEEIKEGDLKFDTFHKEICEVKSLNSVSKYDKKIISTTDKSLSIESKLPLSEGRTFIKLPQIPQSFIEYFVEQYNKGNVIGKVLVEYIDNGEEDWIGDDYHGEPFWNEKIELKINPDNTINTYIIKDVFTRQELEHFFKWMKDRRVYLDTNGCIEYKISFEKELGLSEIFDKYLNLQSDL